MKKKIICIVCTWLFAVSIMVVIEPTLNSSIISSNEILVEENASVNGAPIIGPVETD